MPKFFKKLMWVCALVGGTAVAVNMAMTAFGAQPHEWWVNVYPYLVGGSAGMMFACKMTVKGGVPEDSETKNTILDNDNF